MTAHLSRTGESGPRPEPNHDLDALFGAMTLAASVEIPAPAAAVWDAVTAVERIGEFSPECVAAWWLPGFPASSLGGRFEGKNRVVDGDDVYEWIRPCVIVVFEPFTDFAWTVGDRFDGTPATQWTYRVRPQTSGCVLEQEFQHLAQGLSGLRMSAEADPDHAEAMVSARSKDLHAGMLETLSGIRESFQG